jgi:hypothetical protein
MPRRSPFDARTPLRLRYDGHRRDALHTLPARAGRRQDTPKHAISRPLMDGDTSEARRCEGDATLLTRACVARFVGSRGDIPLSNACTRSRDGMRTARRRSTIARTLAARSSPQPIQRASGFRLRCDPGTRASPKRKALSAIGLLTLRVTLEPDAAPNARDPVVTNHSVRSPITARTQRISPKESRGAAQLILSFSPITVSLTSDATRLNMPSRSTVSR